MSIWRAVRGCVEIRASSLQIPGFSLAFAGLFISEFHSASHAHITSPEPFRKLSLRTAVYGGDHLGAAFL
ncbi:hypothetical protein BON68_20750 [Escherichia coli]|nr:hypothetical protein BON68_20750 [Escherichia coli]